MQVTGAGAAKIRKGCDNIDICVKKRVLKCKFRSHRSERVQDWLYQFNRVVVEKQIG